MNNKIEKLAEQAGFENGHQDRNGNSYSYELEKFAELIIKECDRYIAERFDECEPWMTPGDLLEHFGVEL
jgi:hypothetical protein